MRKASRLMALILALVGLLTFALAEPIDGTLAPAPLALMDAILSGGAYSLSLTAKVNHWPDVSEESLSALQATLEQSRINLYAHPNLGQAALELNVQGQPLLEVFTKTKDAGGELLVKTGPEGFTAYTAAQAKPWETLFGVSWQAPQIALARRTLFMLGDKALPGLLPFEKAVKKSITIKNVGKGSTQLVYALSKAEAQTYFEEQKADLIPVLGEAFIALFPERSEAIHKSLSTLEVTGALNLKRFFTKEGKALGLQLTGGFQMDGQARKLTLFYGVSDTGLYLSLKLPATRGRDTLELQTALTFQRDKIKGDWRYKLVSGKNSQTDTGEVDIKTVPEPGGERLTGTLSIRERTTLGDNKTDFTTILTPSLLFSGSSLDGGLKYTNSSGKRPIIDLDLSLKGNPVDALNAPLHMALVDLDTAGPDGQTPIAQKLRLSLLPALTAWLKDLPQQTRLLVLHDLGREQRTQGESIPPLLHLTESFTVSD